MNAASSKNAARGASPLQLSTFLGLADTSLYFPAGVMIVYDRSLSLAYFIDSYPCSVPAVPCIQFRYCFVAFTSSTARSSPVLYMVASNPPAGLNTLSAAINFASVLVFPCLFMSMMCVFNDVLIKFL